MDNALNTSPKSENVALDPSSSNSKSRSNSDANSPTERGQGPFRRVGTGAISRRFTRAGTVWDSGEDLDLLRHFLIISVTEADVSGCFTTNPCNGVFNPYCTVEFDCMMTKEHKSIKTRKIYDSDGNPKWNFVKRYQFMQSEQLPQTIKFTVWDYDETGDKEFGHCSFTHPVHGTTPDAGDLKWHCSHTENLPLSNSKGTLRFGIYYKCCSLNDLARSMDRATTTCVLDAFDTVATDWYEMKRYFLYFLLLTNCRLCSLHCGIC